MNTVGCCQASDVASQAFHIGGTYPKRLKMVQATVRRPNDVFLEPSLCNDLVIPRVSHPVVPSQRDLSLGLAVPRAFLSFLLNQQV